LSGGQKQRVAIAGVIAMNPDIVIFDEATAMLDPRGKKEIHQVIAKMRDNHPNLTILSITHDIEEAYLSDYILVLSGGNVLLEGSPDEVFSQEEILLKNNLDIPFFYKMKKSLIEQGIDVSNIRNLEGLVEYLCR
jgi:energy-coupling factor transport system ATP-binding protein